MSFLALRSKAPVPADLPPVEWVPKNSPELAILLFHKQGISPLRREHVPAWAAEETNVRGRHVELRPLTTPPPTPSPSHLSLQGPDHSTRPQGFLSRSSRTLVKPRDI